MNSVNTRCEAVARLYHSWITGLILALNHRAGSTAAADFVFQLFRTQHLKRFLPGLEKLGLDDKPHAVACAMYHYLSNQIGGVKVEYLAESDRKAWVRYPPPRWIWDGTAICGIPTEVNLQMMRGWHAHNGVSLNNPRLGFVCTAMTTDGDPGLEGYYYEYDHELSEEERLRFAPDETCPPIDPNKLPRLDAAQWPVERQAKAYLYYAMEYISNGLPLLEPLLGAESAKRIGGICARQTGMHNADQLAQAFGRTGTGPPAYAQLLSNILCTDGSTVRLLPNGFALSRSHLFDVDRVSEVTLSQLTECLAGVLTALNRFLTIDMVRSKQEIVWTIRTEPRRNNETTI